MVRAVTGANWGDEGKGKITDLLAEKADMVVRFQGGANAGHTIINDYGKFALHQLPSGIFNPDCLNLITAGVALDPDKLAKEIESVTSRGIKFNLKISDRTGIVMPYHPVLDACEDERRGERAFGSTKSGIAPFYSDKYAKNGVQAWMLYDEATLRETIEFNLGRINALMEHLYNKPAFKLADLLETAKRYAAFLEPYIADTAPILREGGEILAEGQLGSLRDVDHGIYPYVTSSNTLGSYAAVSAGIGRIDETLVVAKAYSSAVGAGAFVAELFGEEGNTLREKGGDAGEYGATTGRPRRVGYFDAVATRYGAAVQGAASIAFTALDCLSHLAEIPVCVAYELDGGIIRDFPNHSKLSRCKPVYERLPGWKRDIRGVTDWDKLPAEARDYVDYCEKLTGVTFGIVSTGPKRHEILYK